MNEHDVVMAVPVEVKKVLKYIRMLLLNKNYNSTLEFYPAIVNNRNICVLEIDKDNGNEQVLINILNKYDYLFYQQLFISIFDIYLESNVVELSGIYSDNDNFDYYLFMSNININIKIKSKCNLEELVHYCNERIITLRNKKKVRKKYECIRD